MTHVRVHNLFALADLYTSLKLSFGLGRAALDLHASKVVDLVFAYTGVMQVFVFGGLLSGVVSFVARCLIAFGVHTSIVSCQINAFNLHSFFGAATSSRLASLFSEKLFVSLALNWLISKS